VQLNASVYLPGQLGNSFSLGFLSNLQVKACATDIRDIVWCVCSLQQGTELVRRFTIAPAVQILAYVKWLQTAVLGVGFIS